MVSLYQYFIGFGLCIFRAYKSLHIRWHTLSVRGGTHTLSAVAHTLRPRWHTLSVRGDTHSLSAVAHTLSAVAHTLSAVTHTLSAVAHTLCPQGFMFLYSVAFHSSIWNLKLDETNILNYFMMHWKPFQIKQKNRHNPLSYQNCSAANATPYW